MYSIQGKKRKNSKDYKKTIFESESEKEIINYMEENNLNVIEKPYLFTHLRLNNDLILTCSYLNIICSPQKILDTINAK